MFVRRTRGLTLVLLTLVIFAFSECWTRRDLSSDDSSSSTRLSNTDRGTRLLDRILTWRRRQRLKTRQDTYNLSNAGRNEGCETNKSRCRLNNFDIRRMGSNKTKIISDQPEQSQAVNKYTKWAKKTGTILSLSESEKNL